MNQHHNHIKINRRIIQPYIKTAVIILAVLLGWLNNVNVQGQTSKFVNWSTGVGSNTLHNNGISGGASSITGVVDLNGYIVTATVTAGINLSTGYRYRRPNGHNTVIWSSDKISVYNSATSTDINRITTNLGGTLNQWFWTYKHPQWGSPPNTFIIKFDKDVIINQLGMADIDHPSGNDESYTILDYSFDSQTNTLLDIQSISPDHLKFSTTPTNSDPGIGVEYIKLTGSTTLPANTEFTIRIDGKAPSGSYQRNTQEGNNNVFFALALKVSAPCAAGTVAPNLSATSATVCAGSTFNLGSVTANTPSGASLRWYTTPDLATPVNALTVGPGVYYAAFYDATNNCKSPMQAFTVKLDSDCDGKANEDDLDDDNDGILDTMEGCSENEWVTGAWTSNNNVVGSHDGGQYAPVISAQNPATKGPGITSLTISGSTTDFPHGVYTTEAMIAQGVNYTTLAQAKTNNDYVQVAFTTAANFNGIIYRISNFRYAQYTIAATGAKLSGDFNYAVEISKDNFATSSLLVSGRPYGTPGVDFIDESATFGDVNYYSYEAPVTNEIILEPGKTYTARIYLYGDADGKVLLDDITFDFYQYRDTDGDGTPDCLDTDSDGDGCPDAVEGSENVLLYQIHSLDLPTTDLNYAYRGQIKVRYDGTTTGAPNAIISTSANANGVPQLVNNAGNNFHASTNPSNLAGVADNTDSTPTADIGQGVGDSRNKDIFLACNNYWMGNTTTVNPTNWDINTNWTQRIVPASGKDIEFATVANFGTEAVNHLYLAQNGETKDRIIGNLINNSKQNLVITTGDKLTINGTVKDENATAGTIIVKSSATEPTGTLWFNSANPPANVQATVEFYNKGYDCNCGEYQQKWQYFGIPVASSAFPYSNPVAEKVNQWDEPTNGNKWITPATPLTAFKGYEITNTANTTGTGLPMYSFSGTLATGDKTVNLTKTSNVNYSGMNLIGNSYTAAIPINKSALLFTNATNVDQTVYLFNTGTRDEWRKLNGSTPIGTPSGAVGGQYLGVPINLAGSEALPKIIPSMHAFMVKANAATTLTIKYDLLQKNSTVNGMAWRSANASSDSSPLGGESPQGERGAQTAPRIPGLVVDVIGPASADRVWLFVKEGTTRGFDNGWDGTKMTEPGLAQLYIAAEGGDKFQVATVPSADSTALGFVADTDGEYTFNFALFDAETSGTMYLVDTETGARQKIEPKAEYSFTAKKGEHASRFRIEGSLRSSEPNGNAADRVFVTVTAEGGIMIENKSGKACSAIVFDRDNKLLHRKEVRVGVTETIQGLAAGTYIVRLQNAEISAVRRVTVE